MKGMLQIILNDESQEKLKLVANYKNLHCHHVTVFFGASDTDSMVVENVGKIVTIGTGNLYDDGEGCDAIRVVLPSQFDKFNRIPHVTISTADGVKPVKSNEVVDNDAFIEALPGITLKGRVAFVNF